MKYHFLLFPGIKSFEVKLETLQVIVETDLSSDAVLEIIKKCGKETTFVGAL